MRLVPLVALLLLAPCMAQGREGRIDELIRQLGAEDPVAREEASLELIRIGPPALDAVRAATRLADPEVQARAKAILFSVRWGALPPSTVDLLTQLVEGPRERRADAARRLSLANDQATRSALLEAWWEVDDPKILCQVSESLLRGESVRVEERLRAAVQGGNRDIQRALANVCLFRELWSEAADLFARAREPQEAGWLVTREAQALLALGRDADLVDALSGREDLSSRDRLWLAEAYYRLGRRAEAEAMLRGMAFDMESDEPWWAVCVALRHGSYRFANEDLQVPCLSGVDVVSAWAACGEDERAEAAWRKSPADDRALLALLASREDDDLATQMFLEEAENPLPEDAARHHRLALAVVDHDPEIGLAEIRKAVLLDPTHADWFAEYARLAERLDDPARARDAWKRASALAPAAEEYRRESERLSSCERRPHPRGYGVRVRERPYWWPSQDFVCTPRAAGGAWYYLDASGDVVKASDGVGSAPSWRYRVPCDPPASHRGGVSTSGPFNLQVAELDGDLYALVDVQSYLGQPGDPMREYGIAECVLCILDPATGAERMTRAFPSYEKPLLFAEEGLVTFTGRDLDVFDLRARAWRWSVPLHQGPGASAVVGEAVYAGFPSGVLYKLRASDGELLWRKSWPEALGVSCELLRAGGRLLFRSGSKLVCVGLQDDSIEWSLRLVGPPNGAVAELCLHVIDDLLVCCGRDAIRAISLDTGAVRWTRASPGLDRVSPSAVLGGILLVEAWPSSCAIDMVTGELLSAKRKVVSDRWTWSPMHVQGGRVLIGGNLPYRLYDTPGGAPPARRGEPVFEVDIRLEPPPKSADWDDVARAAGEDPRSATTLLEDATSLYGPRDRSAWTTIAEACLAAGERSWAETALLNAFTLAIPSAQEVRHWKEAFEAPGEEGSEPWSAGTDSVLWGMEEEAATVEAITKAEFERIEGNLDWSAYRFVHLAYAEPVDVAPRRIAWFVRSGDGTLLPNLLRILPGADEEVAVTGVAALLRQGSEASGPVATLWPRNRHESRYVRSVLRVLVDHPSAVVRGGALAALELAGEAVAIADAEACLDAAVEARDPLVRLAAAASRYRRGVKDAGVPIVDALCAEEQTEKLFAIWLCGRLRLAEAVPHAAAAVNDAAHWYNCALVAIGTEDAWRVIRTWLDDRSSWRRRVVAGAIAETRSAQGWATCIDRWKRDPSHAEGTLALTALRTCDLPEARRAKVEISLELLRLCPRDRALLDTGLDALLEEGRAAEARVAFERLEALSPPNPRIEALRMRLLALEGDVDGARRARDVALDRLGRSRGMEPDAWQTPFEMARLWARPASIAEPATARSLFEEALRLAPGEPEILEGMDSLDRANGDE